MTLNKRIEQLRPHLLDETFKKNTLGDILDFCLQDLGENVCAGSTYTRKEPKEALFQIQHSLKIKLPKAIAVLNIAQSRVLPEYLSLKKDISGLAERCAYFHHALEQGGFDENTKKVRNEVMDYVFKVYDGLVEHYSI